MSWATEGIRAIGNGLRQAWWGLWVFVAYDSLLQQKVQRWSDKHLNTDILVLDQLAAVAKWAIQNPVVFLVVPFSVVMVLAYIRREHAVGDSQLTLVSATDTPKAMQERIGHYEVQVREMQEHLTRLTNDTTVQAGQLEQAQAQEIELHAQMQQLNSRLMDANQEFIRLRAENEELQSQLAPPLPLPSEPLNKELVIAIRTYGLPGYNALRDILGKMFEPISDDPGLVKFLPSLFSEGKGQRINEAGDRLVARLDAPDSSEPFHPIWEAFQQAYTQELVFWVGRVNFFAPVNETGRQLLQDWLATHDEYMKRLKELGNAPDGEAIKATIERFSSPGATYRQRLVDAINLRGPDTGGSSS